MLGIEELKEIEKALHDIEVILNTLPRVSRIERAFTISIIDAPDPIRYVCKGSRGEYVLIFTWEHILNWKGNYEVLGAFLEEEIIRLEIYPDMPKCTYIVTSSGLLKV